jgi:hypothetical protein
MKNRKTFLMALILILYFSIIAQALTFSNEKVDKDNIAGLKTSFGPEGMDMVLVKYDSSGVHQWDRTWGRNNEEAMGVAVDSSDNVYLEWQWIRLIMCILRDIHTPPWEWMVN